MEKAAECLRGIITLLVDKPEEIRIRETSDEMGVLLTLNVAQEDMGKIIGRVGNTAKAIRSVIRAVGMKNGARVSLKIDDPNRDAFEANRNSNIDDSQYGVN